MTTASCLLARGRLDTVEVYPKNGASEQDSDPLLAERGLVGLAALSGAAQGRSALPPPAREHKSWQTRAAACQLESGRAGATAGARHPRQDAVSRGPASKFVRIGGFDKK